VMLVSAKKQRLYHIFIDFVIYIRICSKQQFFVNSTYYYFFLSLLLFMLFIDFQ
jgi:hypothetical protein